MRAEFTGWPLCVEPNTNPAGFTALAGLIDAGLKQHTPVLICVLPVGINLPDDETPFVYAPAHVWSDDVTDMTKLTNQSLLETARQIAEQAEVIQPSSDVLSALNEAIICFERDTSRQYLLMVVVRMRDEARGVAGFWLNGVPIELGQDPKQFFVRLLVRHMDNLIKMPPVPGSESGD